MGKKIQQFICRDIDNLVVIEDSVNKFMEKHNVLDIKVNVVNTNIRYGDFAIVYTVVYQDE